MSAFKVCFSYLFALLFLNKWNQAVKSFNLVAAAEGGLCVRPIEMETLSICLPPATCNSITVEVQSVWELLLDFKLIL